MLTFIESKKPVYNPSSQGVQIQSTPKGNRAAGAIKGSHSIPALDLGRASSIESLPHLSVPRDARNFEQPVNTQNSEEPPFFRSTPIKSISRPLAHIAVQATPPRGCPSVGSSLDEDFERNPHFLQELSNTSFKFSNFKNEQLIKKFEKYPQSVERMPTKPSMIQLTPIKQRERLVHSENSGLSKMNVLSKGVTREIEATGNHIRKYGDDECVYKSLGWNDYEDFIK